VSNKHTILNSDFLSIADLSAGTVLDIIKFHIKVERQKTGQNKNNQLDVT